MTVKRTDNAAGPRIDPAYELTETGVVFKGMVAYERWEALGKQLAGFHRGIQWLLGDWLIYGEGRGDWGDTYTQALDATALDYQTLCNYKWVASKIPHQVRRSDVSWSHHAEVASLPAADQMRWLKVASDEKLNLKDFRYRLRGGTVAGDVGTADSNGTLLGPATDDLAAAKAAYRKLAPGQRAEFLEWVEAGCV